MKSSKNSFLFMMTCSGLLAFQGCSEYKNDNEKFYLTPGQNNAVFVLGQARHIDLYGVTEPLELIIKPPVDKKIVDANKNNIGDYKIKLLPGKIINISFDLLSKNNTDIEKIEFRLSSYRLPEKLSNSQPIIELSGKVNALVGYKLNFTTSDIQKATVIDLNEFNKFSKYVFSYKGSTNSLKIKLLAPEKTCFKFSDGSLAKTYEVDITSDSFKKLAFTMKPDWTDETYERIYKFEFSSNSSKFSYSDSNEIKQKKLKP